MKTNGFLLILILCISINARTQTTESTLTIGGKSKISVLPDITNITIELSSENENYSKCLDSLKAQTEYLRVFLEKYGVEKNNIKSRDFEIRTNYNYSANGLTKDGYKASQDLVIVVINDLEKVNNIANAIGSSNTKGNIRISFELSEISKDSLKTKLISAAINDAMNNSKIIAKSSGIKLGEIIKINYGVETNFMSRYNDDKMLHCVSSDGIKAENSVSLTITPQEIELIDEITLIWKIQN